MDGNRFTLNMMKKPSEIEMDGKMISKYDVVRLLNEQDKKIRELESKQQKKVGGWHNAKEYFEKLEEGDERQQD